MAYKIYTDKNENFECEVSVKNASLKGLIARLVVESDNNPTLVFNGTIKGDKCIIPIKRLKGILDENTRGNIHLELIVEDTYFKPWKSEFIVEQHTSVKVAVNEQSQPFRKPIVAVNGFPYTPLPGIKKKEINLFVPKKQIATICERFGIKKSNLRSRKEDVIQILKEYIKINSEYNKQIRSILSGLQDFLK